MESSLRIDRDDSGIVTIWMDTPGKSVNLCNAQFLDELSRALGAIERDPPAAAIIASAKPRSFNAGADLFGLAAMNHQQRAAYLSFGQSLMQRISNLPMPTAAAVGGNCLGGGCELALACRYRVASDDSSIAIGLPEVILGLIPVWGGTTRLPRLIGLRRALPLLVSGQTLSPHAAHRTHIVDQIVPPQLLMETAREIVRGGSRFRARRIERIESRVPLHRLRALEEARHRATEPAAARLLAAVGTGFDRGYQAGLDTERRVILDLLETPATRARIEQFIRSRASKPKSGPTE